MSLKLYMRMAIWDLLLACVTGMSLTYVVLDSFYINPAFQYSPLPGVISMVLIVALFLAARNRQTALVGGIIIGIACVGGIFAAIVCSPSAFMADTEETYFYAALVCVLVPLLSFGLTRSHVGCVLYFAIGAFICAWMQFFYEFYEIVWTLLFVICSLMLVVYKNYQQSARRATSVRTLSFSAGAIVALCAAGASVGIACIVWFGIIAPLDPEALEIKLIEEYRALETIEVVGTSDEEMTPNMELASELLTDRTRTTDDLLEDELGTEMPAPEDDPEAGESQSSGMFSGLNIDSVIETFESITDVEETYPWHLLLLILIPLAIIAYFVGRRVYRTVRLRNIQKLSLEEQVQAIYLFIMKKLQHLGFRVPEGSTLREFADNNEESLREFREVSGVSFTQLTALYTTCVYGRQGVAQQGADSMALFYQGFWKAARKKLGNFAYFIKSFAL